MNLTPPNTVRRAAATPRRPGSIAAAAVVLTLAAGLPTGASESPAAMLGGDRLAVRFELIENQHQGTEEFLAELTLVNRGSVALPGRDWELYFNFGRPMRSPKADPEIVLDHVNGDLWRLRPTAGFTPLEPTEERRFALLGRGAVTRRSDAPAGPYLVAGDGSAQAIADYTVAPFRGIERLKRAAGDRLPVATPSVLFERNRTLETLTPESVGPVVPTPARLELGTRQIVLDPAARIAFSPGLESEAVLLAGLLEPRLGRRPAVVAVDGPPSGGLFLGIGPVTVDGTRRQAGDEAYRLTAAPDAGVEIVGTDPAGVFYGIQTLRALLPIESRSGEPTALREVLIEDAPRFGYRGLHLDVSRNFHPRETVEKLLDLAAFYKLNRFHFHLTDDEGWRLPVASLPELTEIGSRRGHTKDESDRLIPSFGSGPDPDPAVSHGSGAYTREDLLAILRRANERHIRVIPEVDVPGHARAAIKAMAARQARLLATGRNEQAAAFLLTHPDDTSEYRSVQGWDDNVIDVCMPSTYRFLETVFDEIVGIWAEAEAPLEVIHVGGDEIPAGVWQGSPACQQLLRDDPELADTDDLWDRFLHRLGDILAKRGLAMAGWEEIGLTAGPHGTAKEPNKAFLERDFRPYVWNNVWGWGAEDLGYQLANAGYRVVLANATNLYFDLVYDKHPEEPGYAWAGMVDTRKAWEFVPFDLYQNGRADLMGNPLDPATAFAGHARLTAEGRQRIDGIQGQLWAENSLGQAVLEYQAFPKLLGLAERAWAAQPGWARIEDVAERDPQQATAWNEFANRLGQRELPRLDRLAGGVLYRLPPPGVAIRDGVLEANTAFPGLAIRYTTDGSEPTAASALYTGPVAVEGTVKLATFDSRGRGSRLSEVEAATENRNQE
jgi:hexosaminidase